MSDDFDFISDLPIEPPEARARSAAALRAAVDRELRRRRSRAWAVRTAAVAAAMFVGWSFLPGSTNRAAQPLLGLADAVEALPAVTLAEGGAWYTRSERVELIVEEVDGQTIRFLRPETREVWIGGAGSGRVLVTYGEPEFLSPQDRDAFYASNLVDVYGPGTEEITTVEEPPDIPGIDWNRGVDDLQAALWRQVAGLGDPSLEEVEMLKLATRLIRANEEHPERRSALLRVIADLPGITVTANGETVDVTVDYDDGERPLRARFEFDASNAHLVEESIEVRGEDPGSILVLRRARYDPPRMVTDPPGTTSDAAAKDR